MTTALRDLRRILSGVVFAHRRFAALLVSTITLGVAAAATALAVASDALQNAVPFNEPDRLQWIASTGVDGREEGVSFPMIAALENESRAFESVSGFMGVRAHVTRDGVNSEVRAVGVTSGFFRTLRINPVMGRHFAPEDDRRGAEPVVVVSFRYWQTELGGNRNVLERSLDLSGRAFRIIAVAPGRGAFPSEEIDLWLPARQMVGEFENVGDARFLSAIARLNASTTVAQAMDELRKVQAATQVSAARGTDGPIMRLLQDQLTRDIRPRIVLLVVAAGLMLLLALTGGTSLMTERMLAGSQDLAIRSALGESAKASAMRFLAEFSLYAAVSFVSGLGLSAAALRFATRHSAGANPEFGGVQLGSNAVIAGLLLAVLVACAGLMLPLIAMGRARGIVALQSGFRTGAESPRMRRIRDSVVAVQIAASIVLAVSGAALISAYVRGARSQLGIDATDVTVLPISLPMTVLTPLNRDSVTSFYRALLDLLHEVPGFADAALTTEIPTRGNRTRDFVLRAQTDDSVRVGVVSVSSDFFRLLGVPLTRGNGFAARNDFTWGETEMPAVLDKTTSATLFGAQNPIGQSVRFLGTSLRIVGTIGTIKQELPAERSLPQIYVPYGFLSYPWCAVLVRSQLNPSEVAAKVADVVRDINPRQPLGAARQLSDIVDDRLARSEVYATLLASSAALALLLTIAGLYGVTSLRVRARSRELAIRAALGASPRAQFANVLVTAAVICAAGVTLGAIALRFSSGVLATVLYGVAPLNGWGTVGLLVAMFLIVLSAAIGPAWRAGRTPPSNAMALY